MDQGIFQYIGNRNRRIKAGTDNRKIKEEQQTGKLENDWRNRSNEAGTGNSRRDAQTVKHEEGWSRNRNSRNRTGTGERGGAEQKREQEEWRSIVRIVGIEGVKQEKGAEKHTDREVEKCNRKSEG